MPNLNQPQVGIGSN